jgi:hypothetical protein
MIARIAYDSIAWRKTILPLGVERGVRQKRTCDSDKLEVMGHRRVIYQSVCDHDECLFLAINLIVTLQKDLESGCCSGY